MPGGCTKSTLRIPVAILSLVCVSLLTTLETSAEGVEYVDTLPVSSVPGMTCAVQAAPIQNQNITKWVCAGAVSTNGVNGGTSTGATTITATSSPASVANCTPTLTNEAFVFTYQDAFGSLTWSGTVPYQQSGIVCQTFYGSRTGALPVTGTGAYWAVDELCQFSTTGVLGSSDSGVQFMTFRTDSSTGCVPSN